MNSRSRIVLSTLLLMTGALLLALSFVTPAHAEDVKATDWVMKADDGKGQPGEGVDSFLPTDHVQHFEAKLSEGVPVGTKLKWTFTAVDTDQGKNTKITDVEITTDKAGANNVHSSVSLPRDWPIGDYKVELFVNGKSAGSFDYSVEKEEGDDKDN